MHKNKVTSVIQIGIGSMWSSIQDITQRVSIDIELKGSLI